MLQRLVAADEERFTNIEKMRKIAAEPRLVLLRLGCHPDELIGLPQRVLFELEVGHPCYSQLYN